MTRSLRPLRFADWLVGAISNIPLLSRLYIRRRLTLCFVLVILLMLVGDVALLSQLLRIRAQVQRLGAVDEELIEVQRVHSGLQSFYERLGVSARSESSGRLLQESDEIRRALLDDAQRTQVVFSRLPPEVKVNETVQPTLESIERTLLSHLDAIRVLVESGQWEAARLRLDLQVQPLESLSSDLVENVAHEVAEQRAQAALNIAIAERQMLIGVAITGFVTLLIAAGLGVAVTRSITQPLEQLVEGSKALARGEFQHIVPVIGKDELAQLTLVFNETTGKLGDLFTERKMREEEIRKFASLVENSTDLIGIASLQGEVLFINATGQNIVGLAGHDVRRTKIPDYVAEQDLERFRAEVLPSVFKYGQWEGETLFKHFKTGAAIPMWQHVFFVTDEVGHRLALATISRDITERKRAEEKLQHSERELRRIVDFVPAMIMVLNADGRPLYANEVVLDYTGVTAEEFPSMGFGGRLSHPEDVEEYRPVRQAALARGEPFQAEQRLLGKDGRYRWFIFRYNPSKDEHGNVERWYVTATDIEDRKQAEEKLQLENVVLREEIDKASMFEEIVGESAALRTVVARVAKVAPTDSTVLVTGETGTGKELIARAIHKRSQRAGRAFVSVNCAAIPPSLIASELFGHEKGAFTGASQRRLGRFELAEGGTIFLDEVGELPPETQIALLRVMQEREFERVGGTKVIRVDVRVIAATNRDLPGAIAAGTFRNDLYYRLNVFPIEVPSLRERQDDIPLLVEYFIDRYASISGKKIRHINKTTLDRLRSYAWPGNIRELQNVIERSVIVCETENFTVDESWLSRKADRTVQPSQVLTRMPGHQEREMIEAALAEAGGRIAGPSGAAAKLGIPPSTLDSKIKVLGINKHRFKMG